jgi:hypothetical protein
VAFPDPWSFLYFSTTLEWSLFVLVNQTHDS